MLYFAGGYPGLYFPTWMVPPPPPPVPSDVAGLEVEIPMSIVTGGVTRPVLVIAEIEQAMTVIARMTMPLTRGMSERAKISMRVMTPAVQALSPLTSWEIPMRVHRGGTTLPASLVSSIEQEMRITPTVVVPSRAGMSKSVEIPMRVRTAATVERN